MYDTLFVHSGKSLEQRPKIYLDVMLSHGMVEGLLTISHKTAQGP